MISFPFISLFSFILFLGSMISLSSSHWLGVWLGLELNLMGFIPIMIYKGSSNEVESSMKYFLIQALGSGLILFGGLVFYYYFGTWEMTGSGPSIMLSMMMFGLLLKMGVAPFHFWLPSVMSGLSWMANMILVTWQKLIPLFLLFSFFNIFKSMLLGFCLISSLVGGVGGMNQTSLRALLAYSSMVHLGWMLASSMLNVFICSTYFIIYFIISIMIFLTLWNKELAMGKQVENIFSWSVQERQLFCFLFLSLAGMPPLTGFIGKWLVLSILLAESYYSLSLILVLGSLLSLYYYLVLSFCMLLSFSAWKQEFKVQNYFSSLTLYFNSFGGGIMMWMFSTQ